jgi:hypothetical protein
MVKRALVRRHRRKAKVGTNGSATTEGKRIEGGQGKVLPVGKLPLEHLRSLLRHPPKHEPRLLVGPQIGEDAAVIDAGHRYLVVATDPITIATDHIERYAVHATPTMSPSWARARCGFSL